MAAAPKDLDIVAANPGADLDNEAMITLGQRSRPRIRGVPFHQITDFHQLPPQTGRAPRLTRIRMIGVPINIVIARATRSALLSSCSVIVTFLCA